MRFCGTNILAISILKTGLPNGMLRSSFSEYYREHMQQKIVCLRQLEESEGRYVSKNNGSIARIKALKEIFQMLMLLFRCVTPLSMRFHYYANTKIFTNSILTNPLS